MQKLLHKIYLKVNIVKCFDKLALFAKSWYKPKIFIKKISLIISYTFLSNKFK